MRNPTVATEGALTPGLAAILQQVDLPAAARVTRVMERRRRTNLVNEIHLSNGAVLIIKQGLSSTAAARFATAHAASTLLRGLRFELPSTRLLVDNGPALAYWRIDRPTLHERWSAAAPVQRTGLLESWGDLLGRLHELQLRGVGPLADPAARGRTTADYVQRDLESRLLPMLRRNVPEAVPTGERLLAYAADLPNARSVVVHNDMFDQNVLCDGVTCTGLIDFEDAFAGPPEAEIAKLELLHGPLFGQPWTGPWLQSILDAYGQPLDTRLIAAFRCYALLNMSGHGVTIGLTEHSRLLARVAATELALMDGGTSHAEAVRARRVS